MGIKHAQSPQAFFCSLLKRFEYATDTQKPNRFNNHYAAQPGSREGLRKSAQPLTFTLDKQMPSPEIPHISWLFMALAFSAGISPFVLAEHFRKKDLAKLLAIGVLTEAKILGYEWRGEGKGRYFAVIFEFTPIDAPSPISYSKAVGGRTRPTPGSLVSVHYNATFPMLSAIDIFGLSQSIESYPDLLRNGRWKAVNV